jgi:DNA invertase Pin-like site-specific DNA recombinase
MVKGPDSNVIAANPVGSTTVVEHAKANGVYVGKRRPTSIDAAQVRALKAQGVGASAIAKKLGIGCASVYRVPEGDSV